MDTIFATLAFTGLVMAQFAAVVAASAFNKEAAGKSFSKTAAPATSQPGFAARFCKHFDEETAKLYSDVSYRRGGRPAHGILNPLFVAIFHAMRPATEQPTATVVLLPPKAAPVRRGDNEKLPLAA